MARFLLVRGFSRIRLDRFVKIYIELLTLYEPLAFKGLVAAIRNICNT